MVEARDGNSEQAGDFDVSIGSGFEGGPGGEQGDGRVTPMAIERDPANIAVAKAEPSVATEHQIEKMKEEEAARFCRRAPGCLFRI